MVVTAVIWLIAKQQDAERTTWTLTYNPRVL